MILLFLDPHSHSIFAPLLLAAKEKGLRRGPLSIGKERGGRGTDSEALTNRKNDCFPTADVIVGENHRDAKV